MTYRATRQKVHNHGAPPTSFLDELVGWGRIASDDIFVRNNNNNDIYSSVAGVLGPWHDLRHRRAVMLEVLRVLAGFESEWNWNQGTDTAADKYAAKHGKVRKASEIEAGAWQVSANSMGWGPELKNLVLPKAGSLSAGDFQRAMKQDHQLAMEYVARLLRRTVAANGPISHHHIHPWLRKDAVDEFRGLLFSTGQP